jgi:hypothetical protein
MMAPYPLMAWYNRSSEINKQHYKHIQEKNVPKRFQYSTNQRGTRDSLRITAG